MGRPKGYDRDTVLTAAMELFWLQGYEGTSTQELVDHLGVNRNSMYTEFGSKRKLYDTAVRHYNKVMLTRNLGPLEADGSGVAEIEALFRHYVAVAKRPGAQRGCLMCNSLIELAPIDPSAKKGAKLFLDRVRAAFGHALQGARGAGEVRADTDVDSVAGYLTSTWLGMLVLLRAGSPVGDLAPVADVAISHLRSLAD